MEKEQTSNIGTRIPQSIFGDIIQEINGTDMNLSKWLREAVEEKLTNDNKEKLDIEIKYHEDILNSLKKRKDLFKEKEKDFSKIPAGEVSFLLETGKILEKDFSFIKGRINLYKNRFNKSYRISEQDFMKLINQAQEQAMEKSTMGELEVGRIQKIPEPKIKEMPQ